MAKLLHHRHTAKLRPHGQTSYPGLAFLLLLTGFVVMFVGSAAKADSGLPPELRVKQNPVSGAVGVSAVVPAPAPTKGAVILSPRNGAHTSVIPITLSGICPSGLLVSIYKNDVFGGATTCSQDGSFSLEGDLFDGTNALVAKVTDALGQSGPDSPAITAYYDVPALSLPGSVDIGRQLFLQTNTPNRGSSPGEIVNWQVSIVGGTPPYALSWDWGDGTTTLVSRPIEGAVTTGHKYERPGTYRVIAKVTDASANSAYLQMVSVVNGAADSAASAASTDSGGISPSMFAAIWPVYIVAAFFVATFWLGELRELGKLRRRNALKFS